MTEKDNKRLEKAQMRFLYLLETTEHVISVGSTPALQFGCPRFKSQPRDKIV
jgi:hypothetical protein